MTTPSFARLTLAAPLALALLGGCRIIPAGPPGEPAPPPAQPGPDSCGASLVTGWLGTIPTARVRAEISARVGERPIRYYKIGDPVTMDYNAARLNVELGVDGRIQNFRCG